MSAATELDLDKTSKFRLEPVTDEPEEKTEPGLPMWSPDEEEEPTIKVRYSHCPECSGAARVVKDLGLNFYDEPMRDIVKCGTCDGFGELVTAVRR